MNDAQLSPLKDNIRVAVATFEALPGLEQPLLEAARLIVAGLNSGAKVLACGNGGSAADAAHLVG